MAKNYVTVIACGGRSSRLGADKNELLLGDQRLIDRVVERAAQPDIPLALAVRDEAQLPTIDLPRLVDGSPSIGPVSALLSAFRFASEQGRDFALLLASDQPFIPHDLPGRLHAHIGTQGCAVPSSRGQDQYMASLWRADMPALKAYIDQGGRSLWQFAENVGLVRIVWEDEAEDPFADIDDRAQLAAAQERIGKA